MICDLFYGIILYNIDYNSFPLLKMSIDFNPKTVLRIKLLPPSFSEYNLYKFFSQFGPVLRVKVSRSPKTLRS